MSLQGNLATEERLGHLLQQLKVAGRLEIAAAAAQLGVSEMTIRRDLKELEERGALRRVRGGALPVGPMPFADRHQRASKAKGVIAAKLAALVPATGAVAFDASSTIMRLASTVEARDLIVLTNGPDTFQALQSRPGVRAMLTGGEIEPRTGSFVGPLACRAAIQLTVARFFMSAAAIDPGVGATETCLEEAEVKRALAGAAESTVLAVDASKLAARSVAVSIGWDAIDTLVTELSPRDKRLAAYRDHVEIV
jgi:DeoR family transcriptional regulator, fructose operon transcriptional repressor